VRSKCMRFQERKVVILYADVHLLQPLCRAKTWPCKITEFSEALQNH
jgi:hypothetical protein